MHRYPSPDLRDILLPVIASLPTAFFSPRPPPALLPLLSPILRQRLSLLASRPQQQQSNEAPVNGLESNWLKLLTWSPKRAARLGEICSNLNLEPHPVSGELELFEDDEEGEKILYRRLDPETFQAKCEVRKYEIAVIWAWCTESSPEYTTGWKVSEVRPVEEDSEAEKSAWFDTQMEAEEAINRVDDLPAKPAPAPESVKSDNDDDYWASYDRTPSTRTPAKLSPAPGAPPAASTSHDAPPRMPSTDELEYFSRYGSEVQPALDAHDPDEEDGTEEIQSTFNHHNVNGNGHRAPSQAAPREEEQLPGQDICWPAEDDAEEEHASGSKVRIHSPQPSRPASSGRQSPVQHLESSANAVSAAEVGVKQHISTEMKSLFRLAMAAGIEREEFERVVRRELEVLDLMDVS